MKRHAPALIALALIALPLPAACGGAASTSTAPAKPELSAAAACKDFQAWAAQFPAGPSFGAEISNVAKIGPLIAAVGVAPSGQLYSDLKALGAQVITASKATGGYKEGEEMLAVSAAQQVESDCSSVNPGS